jgi:DDE superfamily endonuclease
VVWDRLPAHRSRLVAQFLGSLDGQIAIEYLPPYAPELNPVEYLWGTGSSIRYPMSVQKTSGNLACNSHSPGRSGCKNREASFRRWLPSSTGLSRRFIGARGARRRPGEIERDFFLSRFSISSTPPQPSQ